MKLGFIGFALAGAWACEPCEVDDDCRKSGAGLRCLHDENGDRFCGDCTVDAHCSIGSICEVTQNRCVPGCRAAARCPEGEFCDLETETCVECLVDADCPLFGICSRRRCVECETDAHCGRLQVCTAGNVCIEVECTQDDHCPGNQTCDLEAHECACVRDSDCTGGMVECFEGRCIGPRGACYHRICKRWGALWCVETHSVCRNDAPAELCRWNWSERTCQEVGHVEPCAHDPSAWCKD